MAPSIFDPSLSATAVAETGLSNINGRAGELQVQGYSIGDLAENATYEEATWLLLNGRLPTEKEFTAFRDNLATARCLSEDAHELIRIGVRTDLSATDVLQMGLMAETLDSDNEDTLLAIRRVIASTPTIIAAYWRYRQGLSPIDPQEDLPHAANFLYMLFGVEPNEPEVRGFETFLTTVIEHGLNPSTFAARIIGSTGSDPISAATGAIGALKGSRHGGALERIFEQLNSVETDDLSASLGEHLESGGSIYGVGHSVYTSQDPRAEILHQTAKSIFEKRESTAILRNAQQLEAAVEEHFSEQQIYVNVDYYAAVLLHGLGIPSDLFTAVFALGRSAGWMAHYVEQLESETLLRPRSRYIGPGERSWQPRTERYVAGTGSSPTADGLEGISSILGMLSEPARLELLVILCDSPEPLSYSSIREQSSIDDKGRFNYHLRKLRERFVVNQEGGYSPTDVGRTVIEMLLSEGLLG